MASVKYFGGLWLTFNEELQGQISACLQRTYICIIYVTYKLRFCTSCNLYKKSVQVATCTNRLYKLQLVQVDLYKLQHVQILDLYNLQLVQALYLSVEQCILMNLYFKMQKVNRSDLHE